MVQTESPLMSPRGNKTCIGIRTAEIGQSILANRTVRFSQGVKHKTYSINFQALYK
jgi:hypothetical protein